MPNSRTTHVNRSRESGDAALVRALASPATYPGHPRVDVHETHASWVFVAGDRAYKVKKPLALGFLDYSTLELRHNACSEEVRINQELAPGLYLGVRAIVRGIGWFRLVPDCAPDAVEYAVEMRRFSEEDTFEGLIAAGALTRAHVAAVGRLLAAFHRSAAVAVDWGPDPTLASWLRNVEELHDAGPPATWHLDVAAGFGKAFVAAHVAELRRRAQRGLARDGHGDLRCEHVLARPSVRIVDRIEFDPALRRTDVACDLAFLAMDLEASGQRWAVVELVSAYREAGMDPGGRTLRSFYSAYWALVRAKVALIAAAERDGPAREGQIRRAQRLWWLSEKLTWRARAPVAVVICGPAASGKSTLAAELSRRSEMPVVSSDAVRKRLAHLTPAERARQEHYSPAFTDATYKQLTHDALVHSRRGESVIIDASCRSHRVRKPLLDALRSTGARVLIVRCESPLELTLGRAAERMQDPRRVSDATPAIAEEQARSFEEFDEHAEGRVLTLDTARALDTQIDELAGAVDGAMTACP
ncbi:MAG TPA: AAA family ATPase [Solirubrobacteraceae bacterium]|nr:AAA family ATPase [Solirubrobacteraceae bacterium]